MEDLGIGSGGVREKLCLAKLARDSVKTGRNENLKALIKISLGREEELNSFITDLEEQHSKLRTMRIWRSGRGCDERVALSCQAGQRQCGKW